MSKNKKESPNNDFKISSLSILEIKKIFEQYRCEEMPNWNEPYHYDAEGWASFEHFIKWLEKKQK